ncbi:unnamed protein product [Absidia cylindrospora]
MSTSAQYLSNNTSSSSAPPTSLAPSAYNPFSDHTQRISSLLEYATMPHQKSKLHQLELDLSQRQAACMKKEPSTKSKRRSRSPMREAILKGQFLD